MNAPGKSSFTVTVAVFPVKFVNITGISGAQNSLMTCLHAPHGETGPSVSATTTNCLKSRFPSDTALKIAVRSAQFVKPNDAFSILQPSTTSSSFVTRAAPTGNLSKEHTQILLLV